MTIGRPYKKRLTTEQALIELVECADRQFDPEVVEAFLAVLKENCTLSANQARTLMRRLGSIVPSNA